VRLLLVASDPREFAGIRRRCRSRGPEARLAGHQLRLAARGVGERCAAAAVDDALDFRPEALVSTGFCGALDSRLRIADIVVAREVRATDGRCYPARTVPGAMHCALCTLDHVARLAEEKRQLAACGFGAVDMEAAGVAARALALGLPFYCIRAVTDLAMEDMVNDFNRALTPDGHFDTMKLLRDACRSPLARIPELLRLRKRSVRAARALGDFFADCRF